MSIQQQILRTQNSHQGYFFRIAENSQKEAICFRWYVSKEAERPPHEPAGVTFNFLGF